MTIPALASPTVAALRDGIENPDRPAAQQTLLHHYNDGSGPLAGSRGAHPERIAFVDELRNLGEYPKVAGLRTVANANGGSRGQLSTQSPERVTWTMTPQFALPVRVPYLRDGRLEWNSIVTLKFTGGVEVTVNPVLGIGEQTVFSSRLVARWTLNGVSFDPFDPGNVQRLKTLFNIPDWVPAASFEAKVARGSIATLFGIDFAATTAQATEIPLPRLLAGVRVSVAGVDAPLFYVSPTQVNFQVPFEASVGAAMPLVIYRDGAAGPESVVRIAENALGVFAYERAPGVWDPIIIHGDGRLASPSNPARASDVLIVYATGLGELSNAPASGDTAPVQPLSTSRQAVSIIVSGRSAGSTARTLYAGLAPGYVGLVQINLQLPATLPNEPDPKLGIRVGNADYVFLPLPGSPVGTVCDDHVAARWATQHVTMIRRLQMNRRTFSKTVAVALSASAAPKLFGAPARKLQIGCTGLVWGATPRAPENLEQALKDMATLGYHKFETWASVIADLDAKGAVKEMIDKHGVPLISGFMGVNAHDPSMRKESVDRVIGWGKVIRKYGGKFGVLNAGGVQRDKYNFSEHRASIIAGLNEHGMALNDLGLGAGLHQHTGSAVDTQDEVYAVMEAVDTRYVKFAPDVGQLQKAGADAAKIVKDFLPIVVHMHLKDYLGGPHFAGYCPLGQGKVNLQAILEMVEGANPKANIMVELDGSKNQPYTPFETAQISKVYLEKIGYRFRS